MLLWADDHPRTHESHVRDDLVGCEAMAVDEICSDQAACAAQSGFAVHCDSPFVDCDHFVRHIDKSADHAKGWTCAVVENHVFMCYAQRGKVR